MSVHIQFRRGTAAEWAAANPVLLEGELGLETDTAFYKIGDGVTAYNSLEYAQRGPRGYDFEYDWDGTQLGVKHSNEAEYTYVNLKGDRGYDFQYDWDGTRLGVKHSGEAEYTYVDLKGETGATGATGATGPAGADGADAYVYIAYASDDSGTDFTTTFDPSLDYIAIKATTSPIPSPQASDFTGLWKNYKGAASITQAQATMIALIYG